MGKRRYPLAEAALKKRTNPWQQLSLCLKELGDTQHAELALSQGVLAGVVVEIRPGEVIFRHASAAQERLLARRVDDLAKRLGRQVVFG